MHLVEKFPVIWGLHCFLPATLIDKNWVVSHGHRPAGQRGMSPMEVKLPRPDIGQYRSVSEGRGSMKSSSSALLITEENQVLMRDQF
ncbi:hypothetical protein RRG08_026642 [Elysia crispata]|uniref:Uncharacterized protein n=1 Tax=Elysia crispata TaxID=231223 RepID=A0AAE1AYG0_9GAST|nr:hypothetical protein RRG08_026642 [Elysia crispata]